MPKGYLQARFLPVQLCPLSQMFGVLSTFPSYIKKKGDDLISHPLLVYSWLSVSRESLSLKSILRESVCRVCLWNVLQSVSLECSLKSISGVVSQLRVLSSF